jgi:hypothetical protein
VDLVLDDAGLDRWDLGDLVADGVGVGAIERCSATGAALGLADEGLGQLVLRDERSNSPLMAGLAAPLLA